MSEAAVPGGDDAATAASPSEPCDECLQLLRRNVLIGIGLGLVVGAGVVLILTR